VVPWRRRETIDTEYMLTGFKQLALDVEE